MNPYEELLDKYENLKTCRNELLGIVKTVQPNGFLQKAIRRAEALQKVEKNDRSLDEIFQKFVDDLIGN